MKKLLVVVDCQNDFIDGALRNEEAIQVVPKIAEKIRSWDGDFVITKDTHFGDYLDTNEGKHLPITHCIRGTNGWNINSSIIDAIDSFTFRSNNMFYIEKQTFGSIELAELIRDLQYDYVEFVGFCTDICVVSNAMIAKAFAPEYEIVVDESCCAGVTSESHKAAIETMKMCQIEIIGK